MAKKKGSSTRRQKRQLERDIKKSNANYTKGLDNIFYSLKYKLSSQANKKNITEFEAKFPGFIEGKVLPRTIKELRSIGKLYSENNLIREVEWYHPILKKYAKEINEFLQLQLHYECKFLVGDYEQAKQVLKKIESICVSHWSMEQQFFIEEYANGITYNKQLLNNISSTDNDLIVNLLAIYQSAKAEKNLSILNYNKLITDFVGNFKNEQIKEYFRFKLLPFEHVSNTQNGFILGVESTSSIIDRYLAFIRIIINEIVDDQQDSQKIDYLKNVAHDLSLLINDNRLKSINSLFGVNKYIASENDKNFLRIVDLYTKGNYQEVIHACPNYLRENAYRFELYEILNKSYLLSSSDFINIFPEDSLANEIFEDVFHIITKNDFTNQSLFDSFKINSSFSNFSWSCKHFSFIINEYAFHNQSIAYIKKGFLHSPYLNPAQCIIYEDKKVSIDYLNHYKAITYDSSTINFWIDIQQSFINHGIEIPIISADEFRNVLYNIKVKQEKGKNKEALYDYIHIESNEQFSFQTRLSFYKLEILHGKLLCYLGLNDFLPALELVTSSLIENPSYSNKLKFEILIDKVLNAETEELVRNISAPILLHQYNAPYASIWIAYDNFLSAYDIEYGSQFFKVLHLFDNNKVIYFLKHICVPEVYNSSWKFETQDELDNERIEICLLLAKIDEGNKTNYFNEIAEISRGLLIRKGIKQIDESKIYVDVNGIKSSIEKEVKEIFIRSQILASVSLNEVQKLLNKKESYVIAYFGNETSEDKKFSESNIKLASLSKVEYFFEIFRKIRDKFIGSNEFGLDTYISMRIRHGTLVGEIRSAFEKYKLVTKKNSSLNKYETNRYWLSKLAFINNGQQIELDNQFNLLSSSIDNMSEEFKNKILQIQTEEKITGGYFDYSYSDDELFALFSKHFASIEEYDEFFDHIIQNLWERTEKNLLKVRTYILQELKPKAESQLFSFLNFIEDTFKKIDYAEVNELNQSMILCRTALESVFNKITTWFQRSNNKNINNFDIKLPIEASLFTLKRIYTSFSEFSPRMEINSNTYFEGEYFTQFADLIQILLDNIIQHSRLTCSELYVIIQVIERNSEICITIQNNISDRIDLNELNERINETNQIMNDLSLQDKIRKEGGTGYIKIKKILFVDLKRKNYEIKIQNVGEDFIFKSNISFSLENLQKR